MELTSEIKKDNKDAEEMFDAKKQNDIFYQLLLGQTFKETIETSRGKFVVKFPKQKDILTIDRRVALMRGGVSAESFDAQGNFNLQKIAFLDVVVESGEPWFNNLKADRNFSWSEMPDVNFVDEVYLKAWTFRAKVQEKLRAHEGKAAEKVSDEKGVQSSVGNDVFSGVSTKNNRG